MALTIQASQFIPNTAHTLGTPGSSPVTTLGAHPSPDHGAHPGNARLQPGHDSRRTPLNGSRRTCKPDHSATCRADHSAHPGNARLQPGHDSRRTPLNGSRRNMQTGSRRNMQTGSRCTPWERQAPAWPHPSAHPFRPEDGAHPRPDHGAPCRAMRTMQGGSPCPPVSLSPRPPVSPSPTLGAHLPLPLAQNWESGVGG